MRYRFCLLVVSFLLVLPFPINADALDLVPDRSKDQFPKEFAWYVIPFPYDYPGIGSGIFFMATASNIADTYADMFVGYATGDVGGKIYSLDDLHLIPKTLFVDVEIQDLDKLAVQNYEKRGMNTKKDDYTILEFDKMYGQNVKMTLSFWERRVEFHLSRRTQSIELSKIRDSGGGLIADLTEPYKRTESPITGSVVLDLTDDLQNPLQGMRFEISRQDSPRQSSDDPEFYVINYNLKFYIPIGRRSTVAFNYFRSDANVTSEGLTDRTGLINKIGLNCSGGDTECLKVQDDLIVQFTNQNTNGTSASLGGLDRLRSYGNGRFQGAHTSYFAVELRWNLWKEFTPFDYYIWKDTRTGVQIAFFAETGTVSETTGELWNQSRQSYGVGARMVTGSGFVYRLDIAVGDEGVVPILWFFYPW